MTNASQMLCNRQQGYTEEELIGTAMDHLHCTALLLSMEPAGLQSAGQLARLGISLMLKGLLLYRQDSFPAVQGLHDLLCECNACGTRLQLDEAQHELLTRLDHLGAARYPDPGNPVTVRAQDRETLHRLNHAIIDQLPDDLVNRLMRIDDPEWADLLE